MRKFALILSLVMLFLVGFIPSRGASRVDEHVDSLPLRIGVRLTTDGQKRQNIWGDTAQSDSLYRSSIAQDSTYAPAYYFLSQSLLKHRAPIDSAIYYAQKAYALDSLNKWYRELYAQTLAVGGRFEMARELYLAAIKTSPQDLNSYIMAAMLYGQTKEADKALAVLDSAEMRVGQNSYLSSLKREFLISTNQQDKAIEETVTLTQIDPENIENYMVLANLYRSTKQDSLVLKQYEAALAIDPTSTKVLNSLAQFQADKGNFAAYFAAIAQIFRNPDETLEDKISMFNRMTTDVNFYARNLVSINGLANQIYTQYPTEKKAVELYAKHLIASGKLDEALEVYTKHTADTPVQYDYYATIIDIESYKQRPDSVELYAKRAIEIFPDRHELRLSQANLYSYTKRYKQANEMYEKVMKVIDSDTLKGRIMGSIGDNYYAMSREQKSGSYKAKSLLKKAYKSYDKSLEIFAVNAMVLNNYAYFLTIDNRDLERALDMAGRAIAIEDDNSTYLDTYAWVLFGLGRYEEAKKMMRQVIALDTTQSAEIQFHYAEILAKLGEDFMAEIYYDKALKLGYDAQIIEERKSKLK